MQERGSGVIGFLPLVAALLPAVTQASANP
jgi:hypothetical protein